MIPKLMEKHNNRKEGIIILERFPINYTNKYETFFPIFEVEITKKGIICFRSIVENLCDQCEHFKAYYTHNGDVKFPECESCHNAVVLGHDWDDDDSYEGNDIMAKVILKDSSSEEVEKSLSSCFNMMSEIHSCLGCRQWLYSDESCLTCLFKNAFVGDEERATSDEEDSDDDNEENNNSDESDDE